MLEAGAVPAVDKLFVAPGNPGCAQVAERVDIQPNQIEPLASFVHGHQIDLTVIGPETPLVAGLTERIERLGYKVFGPSPEAARLEGSKSYAKALARQHNIPGPDFKMFNESRTALDYLEREDEGRVYMSLAEAYFYGGDYRQAMRYVEEAATFDGQRRSARSWKGYIKSTAERKGIDLD